MLRVEKTGHPGPVGHRMPHQWENNVPEAHQPRCAAAAPHGCRIGRWYRLTSRQTGPRLANQQDCEDHVDLDGGLMALASCDGGPIATSLALLDALRRNLATIKAVRRRTGKRRCMRRLRSLNCGRGRACYPSAPLVRGERRSVLAGRPITFEGLRRQVTIQTQAPHPVIFHPVVSRRQARRAPARSDAGTAAAAPCVRQMAMCAHLRTWITL